MASCGYEVVRFQLGIAFYRSTTSATPLLVYFDVGSGIQEAHLCEAAEDQGLDQGALYAALEQL